MAHHGDVALRQAQAQQLAQHGVVAGGERGHHDVVVLVKVLEKALVLATRTGGLMGRGWGAVQGRGRWGTKVAGLVSRHAARALPPACPPSPFLQYGASPEALPKVGVQHVAHVQRVVAREDCHVVAQLHKVEHRHRQHLSVVPKAPGEREGQGGRQRRGGWDARSVARAAPAHASAAGSLALHRSYGHRKRARRRGPGLLTAQS